MGLFDIFKRRTDPAPQRRTAAVLNKRGFESGLADRLTAGWKTSSQTANQEIRAGLETTRARSRDLANNNEYARKYLHLVVANVVGASGFTLQSTITEAGQPDTLARELIEDAWEDWCQRGNCEMSGRLSFADVQRAVIEAWARDGEALIMLVRGPEAGPYNFALRLLEIERLPVQYSQDLKNGKRAVMGVEIDGYGKPVAYWLNLGDIDNGISSGGATLTRIEAQHILHVYRPYRPEQVRGIPPMHAVMRGLKMLDGFEEAAIVAARTGAAKMGFFTTPEGDAGPLADDTDDLGNFMTDAEPGVFGVLPRGYDFKAFDPDYPSAHYAAFVKNRLRAIASGLGVTYHGLSNDLEGVNFSSIRSGTLEERDAWMVMQSWFIDAFLRPVFLEWLKTALIAKAIPTPTGAALPAGKYDKFSAHSWLGRRWGWVDPLKDIEASRLAIQTGIASPQMVAAQAGVDVEDVLEQLAEFDQVKTALGVDALINLGAPAVPQQPDPAAEAQQAARDTQQAQDRAELRSTLETLRQRAAENPAPVINVSPVINLPESRVENTIPAPVVHVAAPDVRIDNTIPAPVVHVAAPEVRIDNTIPTPVVHVAAPDVQITMPDELRMNVVSMPTRTTTTEIQRNSGGDIARSVQTERDAT